jgi:allophanate hydrolase subunit 2
VSFVGAQATIEVFASQDATCGRPVATMQSIRRQRGEIVRIGSLAGGAVLYVAVEGGFDIAPVLGSMSTYIRGGLGGWHGRALVEGDRLPLCRESASDRDDCRLEGMDLSVPSQLRVIDGPQIDYFSNEEIAAFFAGEYTVRAGDRNADRSVLGVALDAVHCSPWRGGSRLRTDGVLGSVCIRRAVGAIQVDDHDR